MKRKRLLSILCAVMLAAPTAWAQQEVLASKPNVSYEDVRQHLNQLAEQNNEEAKAQIRLEAEALHTREEEELILLSATIYERLLDEEEKAREIRAYIAETFPNGLMARSNAFSEILSVDSLSADEMDRKYQAILLAYPKENFEESHQEIYEHALVELSFKYAIEGNVDKAIEKVNQLEGGNYYVFTVSSIYDKMEGDKPANKFLPLIEKAYHISKAVAESDDEIQKKSEDARSFGSIASAYADVLVESGKLDEGLAIANAQLEKIGYHDYNTATHVKTISKALEGQGKKEEALSALERYITQGERNRDINEYFKKLYTDVHGPNADVEAVLAKADQKAKEALYAKYEQEMIKEEAPEFTLLNRDGVEVSLADYKGKVVVLDFWATWCGPCVISFPGMQQAVNKYESDPDVEFLFIDTWQREENYQELVEEFMTKNGYTFHVLFDEMKDRSKAVVSAYGVRGIPTKVVIDKAGFIRFKSSGGSDNVDKIVSEMETKIELARRG